MAHMEFMLKFKSGQEYLIAVPKLRWSYYHNADKVDQCKDVDAVLSAAELVRRRGNPENCYYNFYYNGKLITDFTINSYSDPYLVILDINDPFPGYEAGHPAARA